MDETKYQYELDKDGNRVMSEESQKQRIISLFGNLYPFEVDDRSMHNICKKMMNNINFNKPTIIIANKKIPHSVYGAILRLLYMSGWKRFISWTETYVNHSTDQYINGEMQDVASEFSMYDVLFVNVNFGEPKNYLHPHIVRSLATSRELVNKKTFFFFFGTKAELDSKKWLIDEYNDGTTYTSLSKYVDIIDLNPGIEWINTK